MLFEHLRATRELLWQRDIGKKESACRLQFYYCRLDISLPLHSNFRFCRTSRL